MTDYICEDCGAIFDEPEVRRWTENHGNGIVEDWAMDICPVCGSEDYEEIDDDGDDEDSL